MLLCCVDVMTRERAVDCIVAIPESPLRVAFHYSSPQTYWHLCRNGENGRRDAHQWDFSIYARLTRQGGSPCSTMRYWGFCELCRGSRMLRQATRPEPHRTHISSSDGRQSNRMALQSHPPSGCKHFNQFINLGATWRQWLSDSAVVLGLMTARRSRPQ